jgi:hypothetical protein
MTMKKSDKNEKFLGIGMISLALAGFVLGSFVTCDTCLGTFAGSAPGTGAGSEVGGSDGDNSFLVGRMLAYYDEEVQRYRGTPYVDHRQLDPVAHRAVEANEELRSALTETFGAGQGNDLLIQITQAVNGKNDIKEALLAVAAVIRQGYSRLTDRDLGQREKAVNPKYLLNLVYKILKTQKEKRFVRVQKGPFGN